MRPIRKSSFSASMTDRRGAVALMVGLTLPALMGVGALVVDSGVWYLERSRLQFAADAAAMGASRLLGTNPSADSLQAAALQAVRDATGGTLVGAVVTPITVSATSNSVSVTVTSKADGFFASVLGAALPSLRANAVAGSIPKSCIFATSSTITNAINVNNQGYLIANNCGVFSNSSASTAVWLDSGEISGTSVGAVGGVAQSNSGSNDLSPSPGVSDSAPQKDALAGKTAPTPGACSYVNGKFTSWQSVPYHFTQSTNVFCGNTTIGGNGSTDQFDPGIYYVVGGSITFSNADVTSATGVTFVLTQNASYPTVGGFNWQNNSGSTITAPTSGPTAGIVVWQAAPPSQCSTSSVSTNLINNFNGGSPLTLGGAFYAPCGALNVNNNAHIYTASGDNMSVTAETIEVVGSGSINAGNNSPPGGGAVAVLMQ